MIFLLRLIWSCTVIGTTVKCLEADVAVTYLVVSRRAFGIIEPNETPQTLTMTMRIKNIGPENIAASPGNENFDVVAAFAESNTALNPVSIPGPVSVTGSEDQRYLELNIDDNKFMNLELSFVFPILGCSLYSHICIMIENKTYTDRNVDNNKYCHRFDNRQSEAGVVNCPPAIKPIFFNVTSPYNHTHRNGESTDLLFDVELVNSGGAVIDNPDGNFGYNISHVEISSAYDELDQNNSITTVFDVNISVATNLEANLNYWDNILVNDLKTTVELPSEECERYKYLCIVAALVPKNDSTALVTNKFCVSFGHEEVGHANCDVVPGEDPDNTWIVVVAVCSTLLGVILLTGAVLVVIKGCKPCSKSDQVRPFEFN
ncbi:uncharacterized protein [Ptychodera flava]